MIIGFLIAIGLFGFLALLTNINDDRIGPYFTRVSGTLLLLISVGGLVGMAVEWGLS